MSDDRDTARQSGRPTPRGKQPAAGRRDDEPVLPTRAGEDRDDAWGDDRDAGGRDADWYRRQRPPHHE